MATGGYFPDLGYLGFVKQAAFETPLAPVKFVRLESMAASSDQMDVTEYWDGVARSAAYAAKTKQFFKSQFKTFLRTDTGVQLLCYAISGTDVAGAGPDPFTHTSAETNADMQVLSFESGWQQQQLILRAQDCLIESASLECKGAGIAELTIDYIGTIGTPKATPTTVVFETDRPLQMADAVFTPTGVSFLSADVTRFKLDIKNTINQVPRAGSLYPRLVYGNRMISMEADVLVPDTKLYRDVYFDVDAGTVALIAPKIAGSIVALWDLLNTPDHQISITLNNVVMKGAKPPFSNKGMPFVLPVQGSVLSAGGVGAINLVGKNAVMTAY